MLAVDFDVEGLFVRKLLYEALKVGNPPDISFKSKFIPYFRSEMRGHWIKSLEEEGKTE